MWHWKLLVKVGKNILSGVTIKKICGITESFLHRLKLMVRRFQAESLCFQPFTSKRKTSTGVNRGGQRAWYISVGFSTKRSCLTPQRAHNLQFRAALFGVERRRNHSNKKDSSTEAFCYIWGIKLSLLRVFFSWQEGMKSAWEIQVTRWVLSHD